ncbi:hypothetical protein PAAG_04007 [Paracoccidioides lutzii Pb01]|uniref:Uncharacterized protein n=1 Tax=Paracoccidioides lutzii (strain ATCC MYA-826 / Pb01) TaxID=502779 RepID=C1GZR3_PARBA|nr:hypothetical protein PAAG_04007 [Paracoccidioides lutzii Pb01]EEH42086.2 hypothetical protein PAAG_04007 [Paracoccidioides lutzii Pb01]
MASRAASKISGINELFNDSENTGNLDHVLLWADRQQPVVMLVLDGYWQSRRRKPRLQQFETTWHKGPIGQ